MAARLREQHDLDELAARNLVAYLDEEREVAGALPTDKRLVVQRFRDELGDWRICVHSVFGAQVHAPWAQAIEAGLRERLGIEVRTVLKALNTTALLVTHDQQEAFAVADLVGVMRDGQLEQWDAPYELYHRPATRFVADFVGQGVFVAGEVVAPGAFQTEIGLVRTNGNGKWVTGRHVDLLLRPDDVIHDDASALRAEVCQRAFRGAEFLYTLKLPSGARLLSLVPSHHDHAVGEHIGIRIEPDHVVAFARDG
jgi:iron(III) transport system ATP-binding protein